MRAGGAIALGMLLCGCPKQDEAPQGFDPNDRLLQKLKAEQERLEQAGPARPREPEHDPLAAVLAQPLKPESLGVPPGVAADLGPLALALVEVQQSQQVGGDRVSVSTLDRFVRVTLEATAAKALTLDLSTARLEREGQTVPIARDAQRAGRGSALSAEFQTGSKKTLVLYFEAPPEMVGKGLKFVLASGGSRVELPLQ